MKVFRAHLDYLRRHSFAVWPLEEVVAHLREGKQLPERCAVITIDDAYTSVYERAFPLLRERGLPFTVFVATGGVDGEYGSFMTWDQMREMGREGAAFSSHSRSHDYLVRHHEKEGDEEWEDRVRQDISASLKRLKEELNSSSTLFAYPYGEYSTKLKRIVLDMELTGIAQQSGGIWEGSDFGALPRFPMAAGYADLKHFGEKVLSLPLPVLSAKPADSLLVEGDAPPRLVLQLGKAEYDVGGVNCFTGGEGRIAVEVKDADRRIVEVSAGRPLPAGRSRYNCTARHLTEDLFYWYSHPWISQPAE